MSDELWKRVDAAAAKIGAKPEALKKWRVRGVPHRHWFPIIEASSGTISARDLQELRPPLSPAAQIVAGLSNGAAR